MKSGTSKKEMILDAALTLFSERGFDGVPVDVIAEKVGMKGPALYHYFKGKDEILNALLERADEHYEMNFGSGVHPGKIPDSMEELVTMSLGRVRFTLHDEMIRKVRKLFTMEQYRSSRIAALATLHNLTGVQSMFQTIFEGMMNAGNMRREDASLLALDYMAPVTLLIQVCDREPEKEAEVTALIEDHFKHFAVEYGIVKE